MDAVIFNSNTGFSKKYANWIAQALKIRLVDYCDMTKILANGSDVIYVANVKAGAISGHGKVMRRYNVHEIVAVGMSDPKEIDMQQFARINNIKDIDKLHYVQGGLDYAKQKGINKFILKVAFTLRAHHSTKDKENRKKMFEKLTKFLDKTDKNNIQFIIDKYKVDANERK